VTLLAALAGVPLGGESSAHSRGCTLPSPYFGSGWQVRSAKLTLTRAGTWSGSEGGVTATETDVMTTLRHRMDYRYPPLDLTEGCGRNWTLALTFNSDDGAFTHRGTENLTGAWQDPAETPSTGACKAGRVVKNGVNDEPFAIVLGSPGDGFSVRFKHGATHAPSSHGSDHRRVSSAHRRSRSTRPLSFRSRRRCRSWPATPFRSRHGCSRRIAGSRSNSPDRERTSSDGEAWRMAPSGSASRGAGSSRLSRRAARRTHRPLR
jgi:hypothetical protein